jgi:hypothetical protein
MGKKQRGELTYLFISLACDILGLNAFKRASKKASAYEKCEKEGRQKNRNKEYHNIKSLHKALLYISFVRFMWHKLHLLF